MSVVHDTTSRFATPDEAAKLLRISARTVRRLVRTHELPGVKIGGQYRVDVDALDRHTRTTRQEDR
jgi:excisionase family DNA binding protein